MLKKDLVRIVQGFYDGLEEGKILGRRCKDCGHVEYPPYLCCNACGGLDTEWVELTGKVMVNQLLPEAAAFSEPEFRDRVGDFWHGAIQPENSDETGSCIVNIIPEMFDEVCANLPLEVRPVIVQDVDMKIVLWEFADEKYRKSENYKAKDPAPVSEDGEPAAAKADAPKASDIDLATDPIAQTVVACAAEAYGVDESELSMATDIREDLSNESMKMIVMISGIEEELEVTIEISEAGNLNTLADFVNKVKEKMNS